MKYVVALKKCLFGGIGGPSWRLKGAMAPPTQIKFTQYYLVFISFDHVKYKIF
jgi:hypothetical protein